MAFAFSRIEEPHWDILARPKPLIDHACSLASIDHKPNNKVGTTMIKRHSRFLAAIALLVPALATAQGDMAVLTVENVTSHPTGCHVGLRLTNNLPYAIDMFVFDVAAYTDNDVVFEELSISFLGIKPTLSQYQKLRISGISCDKVTRLRIHGGDRCRMGPHARMAFDHGACLSKIHVQESPLIRISK